MKAWMRNLEITLTSKLSENGKAKRLQFGTNYTSGNEDLSIQINGYKYMSSLKDACTIKISNLTYAEVVQIIIGQYYNVEIKAGYRSSGSSTIFKGGILYISNSKDDIRTNTVIILCASHLVATYGQSRLNLSLNSGINLYSAINFICKRAGIPNTNVSAQFKKQFLQEIMNVNDTPASWIDKLVNSNATYITNSDSITESTLSLFDSAKSNARVIKLTNDTISLVNGYPELTSEGLKLRIIPTFSFMCGDVIQIDNSLIQIPVQNQTDVSKNYGYYLDKDGYYMIYQMEYVLQNRGDSFFIELLCKTRSLISNYLGKV